MDAGTLAIIGLFIFSVGIPGWYVVTVEENPILFITFSAMTIFGVGLLIGSLNLYLERGLTSCW